MFKYPDYIKEIHYYDTTLDEFDEFDESLFDLKLKNEGDSSDGINVLPLSIEKLGIHSDCLYKGFITNSVKHLIFSSEFNQKIGFDDIPFGVEILEFKIFSNRWLLLPGIVPNSCKTLKFGNDYFNCDDDNDDIDLFLMKGSIPFSVTSLDMGNFNKNLKDENDLIIFPNPSNIEALILNSFNKPIVIPPFSSVKSIHLGNSFNSKILQPPPTVSSILETINFGDSFEPSSIDFIYRLPSSIKNLIFGLSFQIPLPISILSHFNNLNSISLSKQCYNQEIPDQLKPFIVYNENEFKNYGGI